MPILISSVSFLYGLVFIMWLESWLYISVEIRDLRMQYRSQINSMLQIILAICLTLIVISLALNSAISYLFIALFFFVIGITISHYFSIFWIGSEMD